MDFPAGLSNIYASNPAQAGPGAFLPARTRERCPMGKKIVLMWSDEGLPTCFGLFPVLPLAHDGKLVVSDRNGKTVPNLGNKVFSPRVPPGGQKTGRLMKFARPA
jgi:hypothetical protein